VIPPGGQDLAHLPDRVLDSIAAERPPGESGPVEPPDLVQGGEPADQVGESQDVGADPAVQRAGPRLEEPGAPLRALQVSAWLGCSSKSSAASRARQAGWREAALEWMRGCG